MAASTLEKPIKIPAELKADSITAIIDSREQTPLCLDPIPTVTGTLTTGDYSIRGLENVIAIERKSLPDLIACVGRERERFEREVQRLLAYPVRAIVVEATWDHIEMGQWRSQVSRKAALHSLLGWIARGLPVVMCRDHKRCGEYVTRMLYLAAKRRWRENRTLVNAVLQGGTES